MRSFFGGSSSDSGNEKSTSSSMFSYFSGDRRPSQPTAPTNNQQSNLNQPSAQTNPNKNVPGFQTPQKPAQQGTNNPNMNQNQQQQQQQPQQQQQQQQQQQSQQQSQIDPATIPLKIKLSSPTMAIGTPILCHGYGQQEGIFCWYRTSPSNPFCLITTTLQPSYTPTIDDANNIITCQFKPDIGVASEYGKIGPLRLPPETAHSVIRLMQNKHFINYPITYINTKGTDNINLMQKWVSLMTKIQELEVKKQNEIIQTDDEINKKLNSIGKKGSNTSNSTSNTIKEQNITDKTKNDITIDNVTIDPDAIITECENYSMNRTKYDPQIDLDLALVHQELHSLLVHDSFNSIVRSCPVVNTMEAHNIRHLQDYTLTIDNDTLELVFTPPIKDQEENEQNNKKNCDKVGKKLPKTPSQLAAAKSTTKSNSSKAIGLTTSDDDHHPLSEEEDIDSEDDDHSLISHHKNKSSMGDLLSFLSTGVGNNHPDAVPIMAKAKGINGVVSSDEEDGDDDDDQEEEGEESDARDGSTKQTDVQKDIALVENEQGKDAVAREENSQRDNLDGEIKDENNLVESDNPPKKKLSLYNQSLLWNSIKMPSIPLSSALIFTPRHDITIPIKKNKLLPLYQGEFTLDSSNSTHNDENDNLNITNNNDTTTTTDNNTNDKKKDQTKINKDNDDGMNNDEDDMTITYPISKLLLIMDIRTSFIYTFLFDNPTTRDNYGLALRAMSEKLHSRRPVPTLLSTTTTITPSPLAQQQIGNITGNVNANTSAAMTSVIPPGPVFKSWLPLELQQKYHITAPNGVVGNTQAKNNSTQTQPISPSLSILNDVTPGVAQQGNYFSQIEPLELFETIVQAQWFNELHPGYIPPPPSSSLPLSNQPGNSVNASSNDSSNNNTTPSSSSPSSSSSQPISTNPDNILPDVSLLFKIYQHDQDTLISLLQEKMQFLYQRNLSHKKQSQLLTRQQHMVSLELEIYKEKYYNERAYNDELVQSYYDGATTSVVGLKGGDINQQQQQPILSRQLFRNQQHQSMVKSNSLLSDTRGFDLSQHHPGTNKNNDKLVPTTPQKPQLKPSNQQQQQQQQSKQASSLSLIDSKMSNLTKEMLQASQSTPQLVKSDLTTDTDDLQDKVLQQQQVIQQLKRDNKQLIATNMSYKEQASLANEYEQEILEQKEMIKKLQLKVKSTGGNDIVSSPSVLGSNNNNNNAQSPAITTLQTTIVELTQQTQHQQQDIALKERKIANFETQITKLTQQLHLAYQQQQDLITKGIKVEQEKLRHQFNSTERELNDATNAIDLLRAENNLYKTQTSLMESLHIQQHVEIETLETTIETLQTSIVGLINENEYLKKQQNSFISLQQQFKQQQAQLLLLQHENVTLSNTIQEHQQHIVNLQQQKQMLRSQSLLGVNNNNNTTNNNNNNNNNLQNMKNSSPNNQNILTMMGTGGNANINHGGMMVNNQYDSDKISNLMSELQYYKQKCFSLSTSMERLMRKHHQEMMQSNSGNTNGKGLINSVNKKGGNNNNNPNGNNNTSTNTTSNVHGANTALIDPLNDTSDQELLYKIYTQQSHTMSHEQLCKEYKVMIKQLELLIETNKLLRFDIKQVRLQHDALQQQYNERIKYATPTPGQTAPHHNQSAVTMQTLQRDLLEKQLHETKHLVTTLTFVLQDKQQHIELIKSTNKQLVIELDGVKKQIQAFYLQQQEQQHLRQLQQVANGDVNAINNNMTLTSPNNHVGATTVTGQPFYF